VEHCHAAVLRHPAGGYSIEDLCIEEPRADEVLVRLVATGHCHTDVAARAFMAPPVILGHEGAGVVEAVGDDVRSVSAGDHVVLSFAYCGTCEQCTGGHPADCRRFSPMNVKGVRRDGSSPVSTAAGDPVAARFFGQSSFASRCIAGEHNVVKVDPSLPLDVLAPLGCGLQTGAGSVLNVLRPGRDGSIAVYGVGAVGLAAVMAAAIEGCATIVAVDRHESRLELAAELGATHCIVSGPNLAGDVRDVSGGDGVSCALDTTGVGVVLAAALDGLTEGGVLGTVAVGDPVAEPTRGRSVVGIIEGDAAPQTFIPTLIEHWRAGRFPFDRLTTTFALDEIDQAEAAGLAGEVIKPVLLTR
jgi:aryl-alcohol dehydrogenase